MYTIKYLTSVYNVIFQMKNYKRHVTSGKSIKFTMYPSAYCINVTSSHIYIPTHLSAIKCVKDIRCQI